MQNYNVLFFDMDDTLYPSSNGLWEAIGQRINTFMTERLSIPAMEVIALRDHYLQSFGTTLNGLIENHHVDPQEYLAYVHDIPIESFLDPDFELRTMLKELHQKKVIFTNASSDHVRRVLQRLGVDDLFDQVIDIIALEFSNKPKPAAYQKALAFTSAVDPSACLLAEDRIDNLLPAGALGMTTVLVGERSSGNQADYQIQTITDLTRVVPGLSEIPIKRKPGEN
jgi:putative hydrolase of the HAD superfamily